MEPSVNTHLEKWNESIERWEKNQEQVDANATEIKAAMIELKSVVSESQMNLHNGFVSVRECIKDMQHVNNDRIDKLDSFIRAEYGRREELLIILSRVLDDKENRMNTRLENVFHEINELKEAAESYDVALSEKLDDILNSVSERNISRPVKSPKIEDSSESKLTNSTFFICCIFLCSAVTLAAAVIVALVVSSNP